MKVLTSGDIGRAGNQQIAQKVHFVWFQLSERSMCRTQASDLVHDAFLSLIVVCVVMVRHDVASFRLLS